MSEAKLLGLMAEFETPRALTEAVRQARRAGYIELDAFSPFPLREVGKVLGYRTRIIPIIATLAALVGGAIQYYSQYWMNVLDYPLNVGGRPLHSWPAFIPATIIVSIMWAGAATLIGMLVLARLPRLNHPVFEIEGFERASQDRFFLWIKSNDRLFDRDATGRFLERLGPCAIRDVRA